MFEPPINCLRKILRVVEFQSFQKRLFDTSGKQQIEAEAIEVKKAIRRLTDESSAVRNQISSKQSESKLIEVANSKMRAKIEELKLEVAAAAKRKADRLRDQQLQLQQLQQQHFQQQHFQQQRLQQLQQQQHYRLKQEEQNRRLQQRQLLQPQEQSRQQKLQPTILSFSGTVRSPTIHRNLVTGSSDGDNLATSAPHRQQQHLPQRPGEKDLPFFGQNRQVGA